DLCRRIGGVEGQVDRTDPKAFQIQPYAVDMLSRLNGDTVAGLDAQPGQRIGVASGGPRHVAIACSFATIRQKEWSRPGNAVFGRGEQVAVHDFPPLLSAVSSKRAPAEASLRTVPDAATDCPEA